MHPILFHIGPAIIPSYGVLAALAVIAGLLLSLRTAQQQGVDPNRVCSPAPSPPAPAPS